MTDQDRTDPGAPGVSPRYFRVLSGNPEETEVAALDQFLRDLVAKSSGPQERELNGWGRSRAAAAGFNPMAFNTVVYR